jgi:aspartate racemase
LIPRAKIKPNDTKTFHDTPIQVKKLKRIGILGGMGPEASADIYLRLIKLFYDYSKDDMKAYPHIIINSIPIPNLFQLKDKQIGQYLGNEAARLEESGAEILAIACNSAHYFFNDIRKALSNSVYLINLIEEIINHVQLDGFSSIGLLSTALSKPLYVHTCNARHVKIETLGIKEQKIVDKIIIDILSGRANDTSKSILNELALRLLNYGAKSIVLGCTDLPLLLGKTEVNYPLFSSNEILANTIFSKVINND